MASSRTRQRKLERDRYERKLVRQAQRQRRRRQVQAGLGAFLAIALIGVGTAWLAGAFESEPAPLADQGDLCTWLPRDPADHPDRVDVGTPPANPPTSGTRAVAIDLAAGDTAAGQVTLQVDVGADPCGAANLEYLASQGFYDDTACHELTEQVALRCGDPSGTGLGGPSYAFWGENLPVRPPEETASPAAEGERDGPPLYPAGTVAYADAAGENGSQFLIFYQDYSPENPLYPVIGTMSSGMDVVEAIGEAGGTEDDPTVPAGEVRVKTLTIADPVATGTPSPSAPAEQ